MQRTLLTVLFMFSLLSLSMEAQTPIPETNTGNKNSLAGILRDMNLDERVPFGKVALYQNDKLMYGVDTDMGGQYKFLNIAVGSYQVKASFYGYDFIDITEVKVENGKHGIADLDLRVKNELYAPIALIGKEANISVEVIECVFVVKRTQQYESTKTKDAENLEVNPRSNPRLNERDPYDTPRDLLLYPNPTTGLITIELESEQLHIDLINPLGQVLGALDYHEIERNMVQIDLSSQAAGTYFLNIRHDQGTQIEKVIIVHL